VVRSPVAGGDVLGERLAAELAARGVEVVGPLGLAADGSDAADVATRISGAGVNGLVLATVPRPGLALLTALAQGGLPPSTLPTWVTGGMLQSDLATVAGDPAVVAGLQGVAPAPTPEAPEFTAALAAASPGVPGFYAAQAHDCVVAIALAALVAGGDGPEELRAALGAVVAGGAPCTSYPGCAALLAGGTAVDVDYQGVSGPLDLDADGQPAAAAVDRWEVRPDGRVVVVGQEVVVVTPPSATPSTEAGTSAATGGGG
jgi:branched-chain amino acid transport system substrate-binding protein